METETHSWWSLCVWGRRSDQKLHRPKEHLGNTQVNRAAESQKSWPFPRFSLDLFSLSPLPCSSGQQNAGVAQNWKGHLEVWRANPTETLEGRKEGREGGAEGGREKEVAEEDAWRWRLVFKHAHSTTVFYWANTKDLKLEKEKKVFTFWAVAYGWCPGFLCCLVCFLRCSLQNGIAFSTF